MPPSPPAATLSAIAASLRGDPEAARDLARRILPARLLPGDRVVGLGWATVDAERTIADTAAYPPTRVPPVGPGAAWDGPVREASLGATARVSRHGDVALVVLEPDTEGRLAAFLARHGEGLCLAYVEDARLGGRLRPTALGRPGRLRPHDRPSGPFLLAVGLLPGGASRR